MFIEEDLNDVVYFLIEKTNKMAKQHSAVQFAKKGMEVTVDQWVLIKFIHENAGCSQATIAESAFKDAASITRMLDLLARKNLIERNPLNENRRQFAISLTKKGEAYVNEHMAFVQTLRDEGTQGITASEIATLKKVLLKIQNNLR